MGNTTPPDINPGYPPTGSPTNIFDKFPPIIPYVIVATVLIAAAQFGSTERLAAAFAWLIFVAVLLADGVPAFDNLIGRNKKVK
jgi:hypothetical protein